LGIMADWQHKGWRVNFEGAFQFGHQDVYGIDRNLIEINRDNNGQLLEYYSNIYYSFYPDPISGLVGPYTATQKAPVYSDLAKYINNSFNNYPARNGQVILKDDGTVLNIGGAKFYNSDILGQERFRKDFKINYEGFMLNFDMSYEWNKYHLKPAMTLAYISGDSYPYNNPYNNRNYTGFMTLRDQNYFGLEVMSYAMLEARFMPRPLNLSYYKAYAYNHSNDASNLGMIGAGLTWHPFKRKEKLFFIGNAIGFWSTRSMYKWNSEGYDTFHTAPLDILSGENTTPIPFLGLTQRQFHQYIISQGMASIHVGENQNGYGWVSKDEKASSYLGTELNIRMEMHFEDSLEFLIRAALFLNGSTYKDLYGQPNRNTRRTDYKGNKFYESLGTSNAWGLHSSLTYRF
ncbi:MAG: hypothetical protein ABIA74_01705, partial [bacterium]